MYHIGTNGKIRLAPGTYEISRVPVSRYEFVTSGVSAAYPDSVPTTITEKFDGSSNHVETFDVTVESGKTVDVHYYDQVAYYDKFTHVDTTVNKFYQLNDSNQNTTVKGIRVKDITNVDTDDNVTINQDSPNLKLYFIYVDGTEREITDTTEKAKLRFTYEGSNTTFNNPSTGFSPSTTESSFTIYSNNAFKDNIYTLKATYDDRFSTNFDLVFERAP